MIPKLIHQTAPTAELGPVCQRYQAILRQLHPDWTYTLWTDADNDAFVKTEYPDYYDSFARLPKNIMRADVIRYLLMDRLGGLYLDVDYEMLRQFDQTDFDCVVPWESSGDRPGGDVLGNAFFAAAPGHFFFRKVVQTLRERPEPGPDAPVFETTGPLFLTDVYRRLSLEEQSRVHTPPRRLFNPKAPRNGRERRAITEDTSVYGIHHCHSTWRDFTWFERLKMRASHAYHRFR